MEGASISLGSFASFGLLLAYYEQSKRILQNGKVIIVTRSSFASAIPDSRKGATMQQRESARSIGKLVPVYKAADEEMC
jgi:hypothetical protein